jgi:serine/threonine protein kinase
MGAVYEVRDRESGQLLALKTLLNATPAALYLFKQEFRTLADTDHPNLVRLHELVMTGSDRVFFTMELVRGIDFTSYVRAPESRRDSVRPALVAPATGVSGTRTAEGLSSARASYRPPSDAQDAVAGRTKRKTAADFDRLRTATRQLVEGVASLHAAGKLHRDIKPSNVLVTPDGRVVILDFGVATEVSRVVDEEMRDDQEGAVGTAAYMAPEQAFEEPSAACDWYAVGVMLYEALVGRPPFSGSVFDVLTMKATIDPLAPSECVENVPADLDALCRALLHREPAMRPTGPEILRRLGVFVEPRGDQPTSGVMATFDGTPRARLTGRQSHLRALRDAFEATLDGRSITIRVGGRSGMGKSAVAHGFLDELVRQGSAVVLRGRAYEREAVPYKALDGVVDALSRYLMCLTDEDLSVAMPRDTWALARIFPVLRRVPNIGALAEERITDPRRVRRRAFLALRELLSSLARRRPLVVFVDDAHWGDTDSAELWLELVRPPYAPPLLLMIAYREEEARASPFLSELRARWSELAEVRDLEVGPLEHADARRRALELLDLEGDSAETMADAIARESEGNPFLVEELALSVGPQLRTRRLSTQEASAALAPLTLDQMVSGRMRLLPDGARRLLELVAVSGRPLAVSVARQAAGIQGGAYDEAISLLRTGRFLRAGLRRGSEVLETVHARIRETIVAELAPATVQAHHSRLAHVLEATPEVDVEALATHLLGAGEMARAAQFAERAAEQAAEKLAFDQSARLLRLTLDAHSASSLDGSRLRKRLGEILEWAGRSAEAGHVYLDASQGAAGLEKLDLQRAAAEQLFISGRMDEGTRVLHQVLAAVGQKAPRSSWSALFWFLVYHFWLRFTGLRFQEREPSDVRPEDRLRIDTLYSTTIGFAMVDHILCISMRARVLVDSLRHGDRLQVARAAANVACDVGGNGGHETRTERALWELARRLAEREANPTLTVAVRAFRGCNSLLRGRWREAIRTLDPLVAMITNRRAAQQSAILFTLYSLYFLGEYDELTQRYIRLVGEAEERGNVFMAAQLRAIAAVPVWLVADDPERARREICVPAQWSQGQFSTQWRVAIFGTDLDLYVGDGAGAYERVRGLEKARRKNFYLFVLYVRALTAFARGRAAIASLEGLPAGLRRGRLAEVRRSERTLAREQMTWTAALEAILRAGRARALDDRAGAIEALQTAFDAAQAAEMPIHAAAARHQLGLLLGDDEGAQLMREAEDMMTARGVRAPRRFAAMLVPGRWAAE